MADIKISQLGAAATISDSDVFPMTANGTTVKAAASLIKEYAIGDDDISALGDGSPTGAILALNANKSAKSDIAMIEASVAIAPHAIGAEFYLSGVLMRATAPIEIGDQIVNGTNCAPADDVSSQIQALTNKTNDIISTMSANGAHNYFPLKLDTIKSSNTVGTWNGNSYTHNGVTYTIDDDCRIKIDTSSNTQSSLYTLAPYGSGVSIPAGTYIISFSQVDVEDGLYPTLEVTHSDSTKTYYQPRNDSKEKEVTILDGDTVNCYIQVNNNTVCSNRMLYPLLRLANDLDPNYEPYAMTNKQLTSAIDDINAKSMHFESQTTITPNAVDTIYPPEDGFLIINGVKEPSNYDFFIQHVFDGATRNYILAPSTASGPINFTLPVTKNDAVIIRAYGGSGTYTWLSYKKV